SLQYEGRTIGTEFRRMDVAGVASALGAWTRRVLHPGDLAGAVAAALASGRPAVLDVRVDAAEAPPIHSRVRALDKLFLGDIK
ncbi:MAG: thiamine pyrophosphate-dependent enzyme, partial [Elusimicrobia bacterium]|nr:thiamine pyrophosphate-dependent enzyme [Elusimicrobiota bacterium]